MVKTIMINYTGNQQYVCVCVCMCVEVEAARLVREDRWHPRCRGVARESTGNHPIRGQIHTGQHNFEVTRGTALCGVSVTGGGNMIPPYCSVRFVSPPCN